MTPGTPRGGSADGRLVPSRSRSGQLAERIRSSDMGLNREAHAGVITHERNGIRTQFWSRSLLRAESRQERGEEQRRNERRHMIVFFANSLRLRIWETAADVTY